MQKPTQSRPYTITMAESFPDSFTLRRTKAGAHPSSRVLNPRPLYTTKQLLCITLILLALLGPLLTTGVGATYVAAPTVSGCGQYGTRMEGGFCMCQADMTVQAYPQDHTAAACTDTGFGTCVCGCVFLFRLALHAQDRNMSGMMEEHASGSMDTKVRIAMSAHTRSP